MLVWLALAAPAAGQVEWDGTMLMAPGSPGGLGIFLFDSDFGGTGVLASYRSGAVPAGFGLRAGLAEDASDGLAVLGGVDVSGTLLSPTTELPVGVIWLVGAGLSVGDELLASFPIGLSVGSDLRSEGVLFRPYATPRVALDFWSGIGDSTDLSFAVDLGLDLEFDPSWTIRFGASLGDRETLTIGLTFANLRI
jgi:hypothetical protein